MSQQDPVAIAPEVAAAPEATPVPGDFSWRDQFDEAMLGEAYEIITRLELWNWLSTFDPGDTGFMFSSDPNVQKIGQECKFGHSGASFGFTMRNMQMIAWEGWETYYMKCKRK